MMPHKPTLPSHHQRGFVLIYVILMVGALAVLLAAMQRIRPPSAQGIDKQIGHALQSVEADAFITFILAGMNGEVLVLDPRFEAYQQVLRDRQAQLAASDDRLSFLKELLRSMNYELQLNSTATQSNKSSEASVDNPLGTSPKAGDPSKSDKAKDPNRLSVPFYVRKEPFTYQLGKTSYQITVHPANAKPNLNVITKEALERYLKYLNVPTERIRTLAGVILDWRDTDDMTSDGGAEIESYRDYRPLNAPIRLWQELAYAKDIDSGTLRFLRENFSLDGPSNVAADYNPPAAIAALADLPLRTVEVAYEFQRMTLTAQQNDRLFISDILLDDEYRKFSAAATWNAYGEVRIIRVSGPDYTHTVRYDMSKKKILEEW